MAARTFVAESDETGASPSLWRVVHVERDGRGGTDVVHFAAGPVCCRALRLRMTRPGNTTGLSLSDCCFAVCGLGAVPIWVPTGSGLRAQYFSARPAVRFGLHARAEVSRLEPWQSTGGTDADPYPCGDGRLGPAPTGATFASYAGWVRVVQGGEYEFRLGLAPE